MLGIIPAEKRSQGAQHTLGGIPVFQWQNSWEITFGAHKVVKYCSIISSHLIPLNKHTNSTRKAK